MSSFVKASGGGVDLSTLTNGETLLIGLVMIRCARISGFHFGIYYTGSSTTDVFIDFSKIQSFTIRNYDKSYDIKCSLNKKATSGGFSEVLSQSININSVGTITVPHNVALANQLSLLIYSYGSPTAGFESFTTIDGEIHTKDNLNY